MIVRDVLMDQPTQMPLAERHHPIQALLFDRSHEAFRVRVAVRRGRRRPDHANTGRTEQGLHRRGPVRVPIAQQNAAVTQEGIALTEETAHGLYNEGTVGVRCRIKHADAAGVQFDDERRVIRHQSSRGPDLGRAEVLVDGDPTKDTADMRKVVLVMTRGKLVSPRDVDIALGIVPFITDIPRMRDVVVNTDAQRDR